MTRAEDDERAEGVPSDVAGGGEDDAAARAQDGAPARRRPILERIGMAAIALVLAVLFAAIALAAFVGGEPFLGAMAGVGCLMTVWVGGLTLIRG